MSKQYTANRKQEKKDISIYYLLFTIDFPRFLRGTAFQNANGDSKAA